MTMCMNTHHNVVGRRGGEEEGGRGTERGRGRDRSEVDGEEGVCLAGPAAARARAPPAQAVCVVARG